MPQMERIEELVARKRAIFNAYQEKLKNLPDVSMNPEKKGTVNGFWMPTIVVKPGPDSMIEKMKESFAEKKIDAELLLATFFFAYVFCPT